MKSCIYKGKVRHRRFETKAHAFNYQLYMMFINLDELPTLFNNYRGWSSKQTQRAFAHFRRTDHFGDPKQPLKQAVSDLVKQEADLSLEGDIYMLTHFRYFGYVFNPLCLYYCLDKANENIVAIVAEVSNTPWNEKHCYVLTANQGSDKKHRYRHPKAFHVSPFLKMNMDYHWHLHKPSKNLFVHLENRRGHEKLFDATMLLEREPINQKNLTRVLCAYPVMTLQIIFAIHFEALKLWLKGIKYIPYKKKSIVE